MFLGQYSHALDSKGRLTIPARFREELDGGLVMTQGYEPCLLVYPQASWMSLAQKVAQMSVASSTARSYARLIFGNAFEAIPDKMGRILVPTVLRDYAGIQEEAIVVGANLYVEVWSPTRWRETMEHDNRNLPNILAEVAHMGI
jgi:MraZ protein